MLPRAPTALTALLAALLGAAAAAPGGWHSGEHGPFRWTFRESRHLPFGPFGLGEEQHRRTFVWMGAAAAAPDVAMEALSGGAKRRLPMPTAWATVANVLYLGCRHTDCGSWCCAEPADAGSSIPADPSALGDAAAAALRSWQAQLPEFAAQPLYLTGEWGSGGRLIPPLLHSLRRRPMPPDAEPAAHELTVAGVMLGHAVSPVARFFHGGALETGNGETHTSVAAARRSITCSERMSAVQLQMNDAALLYTPATSDGSEDGSGVEYTLASVSLPDRCYASADGGVGRLEREVVSWEPTELLELTAGMSKRQAYRPSLPQDAEQATTLFPQCATEAGDDTLSPADMAELWSAVQQDEGLRLMLYHVAPEQEMHCSFYIGIFDADGSGWQKQQLPSDDNATGAQRTVCAEELEHSREQELWVVGEGPMGTVLSSETRGGEGRVAWVRLVPKRRGELVLSRAAALTLLSTMTGPEVRRRSKLKLK